MYLTYWTYEIQLTMIHLYFEYIYISSLVSVIRRSIMNGRFYVILYQFVYS